MDPWGPLARLPRPKIQELQNQKLRHFINRYLYPFSPYYRRLFDKNNIKLAKQALMRASKKLPCSCAIQMIENEIAPQ